MFGRTAWCSGRWSMRAMARTRSSCCRWCLRARSSWVSRSSKCNFDMGCDAVSQYSTGFSRRFRRPFAIAWHRLSQLKTDSTIRHSPYTCLYTWCMHMSTHAHAHAPYTRPTIECMHIVHPHVHNMSMHMFMHAFIHISMVPYLHLPSCVDQWFVDSRLAV